MTRSGYRFDGWTAGATNGILYSAEASYPVAGSITFYAK
jgi:uncharacterized repeat protein (TIGR02543 family)